jgi:glycosyltransferase involved in cell wall biosynthesis
VSDGWEVVLISPPEERAFVGDFEDWGARWLTIDLDPGGMNLLAEMMVVARLLKIYRRERAALAHHFTPKGVIYGSLAARISATPAVVNAVTGLGHVFTDQGFRARTLRFGVTAAYRVASGGDGRRVIFQNEFDRQQLIRAGAVNARRTHLIRGSGIDVERFSLDRTPSRPPDDIRVLFAARLLREKGLFELVEAMQSCIEVGHRLGLVIAGEIYPGNPSSLTHEELDQISSLPFVDFVGYAEDVRSLIAEADVVALPSYREGTSRLLMEAGAMEKPVISTTIPGNEGLVIDGETGLLVPPREAGPLREAIASLAADGELRSRLGRAGREHISRKFSEKHVIEETLKVYDEAMNEAGVRLGAGQ